MNRGARWGLMGRTIVGIEARRRLDPQRRKYYEDPVLILDNGARVQVVTVETDTGEYGHRFIVSGGAPPAPGRCRTCHNPIMNCEC